MSLVPHYAWRSCREYPYPQIPFQNDLQSRKFKQSLYWWFRCFRGARKSREEDLRGYWADYARRSNHRRRIPVKLAETSGKNVREQDNLVVMSLPAVKSPLSTLDDPQQRATLQWQLSLNHKFGLQHKAIDEELHEDCCRIILQREKREKRASIWHNNIKSCILNITLKPLKMLHHFPSYSITADSLLMRLITRDLTTSMQYVAGTASTINN